MPVAHLRGAGGVLERLHQQRLRVVLAVGGKFAYLIGPPAIGVLKRHGQHLVRLERGAKRNVAQRRVQPIFRSGEEAGVFQFFVVFAAHQAHTVERGRRLRNLAVVAKIGHYGGILRVGLVRELLRCSGRPKRSVEALALAQVGQADEVARVGRSAVLIGRPHFDAVDDDARQHRGQLRHPVVIVVAEEVAEEEVAVFIVVGGRKLIVRQLHAALRLHRLGRTLLLGNHRLEFEAAELHVGAHSKKTLCTADEARVGGHRHVAGLDELHNLILLAFVAQFEALRIEVERGFGVVVEVHIDLVAHLSVEREVHLLVEVKAEDAAVAFRERGVVRPAVVGADFEFGAALRLHAYPARSEDFFGRSEVELHVGEVELFLSFIGKLLGVAAAEVVAHGLSDAGTTHLVPGQEVGDVEEVVAQARAVAVDACGLIVDQTGGEIFRVFQVA